MSSAFAAWPSPHGHVIPRVLEAMACIPIANDHMRPGAARGYPRANDEPEFNTQKHAPQPASMQEALQWVPSCPEPAYSRFLVSPRATLNAPAACSRRSSGSGGGFADQRGGTYDPGLDGLHSRQLDVILFSWSMHHEDRP